MRSHDSPAAENRRIRVDHDMVFDRRMALGAADEVAVAIGGKAQRAKGHALINLDVVSDLATSSPMTTPVP